MALVGYRNLAWLKARLLPADMGEESDYDEDISSIGLAVAALFDRYTGRELRRNPAARFECPADVESVVIRSYPIEAITSVEISGPGYTGQSISTAVIGLQNASGIVDFGCQIGTHLEKLSILSAGGYWCDDDDVMPEDAAILPDDLLGEWVKQCRAVCEAENTFRTKGAAAPDKKTAGAVSLETLTLMASVKAALQTYIRMP